MEELKSLIRQLPRPFLLLGDFNAKHPAWDFENSADLRGKVVQYILVEESVGIVNQGRPTHCHIQTNTLSAIDLCLCSVGELRDFQLEVDEDLHGSDHFPVYLTGAEYIPQHQVPRWIMDKANWDRSQRSLSKLDYGASKSNMLKCLEPIQNACLRAITGAFRLSPAGSLCVETGMLPLDFSRDMLTLKHFFRIQSLPNSPYPPCSDRPTGRPNSKNGTHKRTTHTIPGTNAQDTN